MSIISDMRSQKGQSQEECANILGISRQTFARLEKGEQELTLGQAVKLAELFGVSVEMFSYNEEERPYQWDQYKKLIQLMIAYGADADGKITKTKLAKLLYLVDFGRYYEHLVSITGLTYRKIQQGPVPDAYFSALDELCEEESVAIQINGKAMMISNIGSVDESSIDPEHRAFVHNIATKWKQANTQTIVDFTHRQLPRLLTQDKGLIPYQSIIQESPENVW